LVLEFMSKLLTNKKLCQLSPCPVGCLLLQSLDVPTVLFVVGAFGSNTIYS